MFAVEAVMRALARRLGEDEEKYALAGLVHDADYEKFPEEHPLKLIEELEKRGEEVWLVNAVKTHAWGRHNLPEPKTRLEWALYTCDELTGLVVAVALVRPDKKLSSVTADSVLKKWNEKSFAAGVHRDQIELCEEKLGIELSEFVGIALGAMQGISDELGL